MSTDAQTKPRAVVLPSLLLALGVWGVAAPYVGPSLGFVILAMPVVEFVDHVVPGVVVLAVALGALARGRLAFVAVLPVALAGLWMTGTHAPLLLQAYQGGAPVPAALFHSLPGMAIFLTAVAALVATWSDAAPQADDGVAPDAGS